MPLPITFANLPAGNNAAALLDQEFAAVAAMGTTYCTATGTNTILLTVAANQPIPGGYGVGQSFNFIAPAANTGPVTVNVNGLGPKGVTWGGAALVGGELQPGQIVVLWYDGTQFQIVSVTPAVAPTPTRTVTASAALLPSDSIVLVNNTSGASLALTPPGGGTKVQRILIADVAGNAGTYPITWVGALSGTTNPNLIDVSWASAEVLWTGSLWVRLR